MHILPTERVDDYLTNVIKIRDWKMLLQKDKLEFLTTFQRHTLKNIYFQNMRMVAREISERRVPTLEEVIETGFGGNGGVCNEVNVFNKLILVSLGFDAYNIAGDVTGGPIPGCHVMTVVRFSPSEQYFIDTASANPLQEPVPLHKLPHFGQVAGYQYVFRETGNGQYIRYQCGGSFMNGDFTDEKMERARFEFTLEEKNYEDFDAAMIRIYTNVNDSVFLDAPFLFRYTEFTEEKCEFVLVMGRAIMVGTANTRKVKKFSNITEIRAEVEKLFPNLKKNEVELAWKVFNADTEPETKKAVELFPM